MNRKLFFDELSIYPEASKSEAALTIRNGVHARSLMTICTIMRAGITVLMMLLYCPVLTAAYFKDIVLSMHKIIIADMVGKQRGIYIFNHNVAVVENLSLFEDFYNEPFLMRTH